MQKLQEKQRFINASLPKPNNGQTNVPKVTRLNEGARDFPFFEVTHPMTPTNLHA
jgi:hypothetical protein